MEHPNSNLLLSLLAGGVSVYRGVFESKLIHKCVLNFWFYKFNPGGQWVKRPVPEVA